MSDLTGSTIVVTPSVAGSTVDIPAGYHSGSKITVNPMPTSLIDGTATES